VDHLDSQAGFIPFCQREAVEGRRLGTRNEGGWGPGRPHLQDHRSRPSAEALTALMAPDPSRRLCLLLLLLLSCRLVPASADGNSLSPLNPLVWLWPPKTSDSLEGPVSKPQNSSPVQSTENPTTHVVPQDGLTEQQTTPASSELPPEEEEEEDQKAGQGGSPATPAVPIPLVAPAASPDMKEENVAGVGAKILNVAQGIRSFVQLWDEDSTIGHSAGTEVPDSSIPTVLPSPAELSSAPQGSKTTLWLSSAIPSSPDAQTTEAGTLAVPTQLPPFQSNLQAPLGRPSAPPDFPGRAFLSSPRIRAPPWGNQEPPRQPQHLEGKGFLPMTARSSQQHRHSDVHSDIHGHVPLLPLVTGPLVTASLSVHGLLSVPSSDPSGQLSQVAALPGFPGTWVSHVAPSSGTGLSNDSALAGNGSLTSTSRCLPLPPTLTLCSRLGIGHFWLPNHLHHTDSVEVEATVQAWGRFLHTNCHPFLAWFFCLLLAPSCGPGPPPPLPPCRQFCEALEDECWNYLAGDRLPVVCASLPSQEDGYCVFIGPAAGNQVATILPFLSLFFFFFFFFLLFVKRP
jgi:hypothetical protein